MTNDLAIKVLEKEERFMLGKVSDILSIISYLQVNDLLDEDCSYQHQPENRQEKTKSYALKNGSKIIINYNRLMDYAQVVLPINLSMNIAENLKEIGNQSREMANFKRYEIRGVF